MDVLKSFESGWILDKKKKCKLYSEDPLFSSHLFLNFLLPESYSELCLLWSFTVKMH